MHTPFFWRGAICAGELIGIVSQAAALAMAVLACGRNAGAVSVFHVGNSLVIENDQARVIKALAVQAGHAHTYSYSVILGAPLAYIWSHPEASGGFEGAAYPVGLGAQNSWDAWCSNPTIAVSASSRTISRTLRTITRTTS